MSRGDAKQLGDYLEMGQAALVVMGESRLQEQLDKALTACGEEPEQEFDAGGKALAKNSTGCPPSSVSASPACSRPAPLRHESATAPSTTDGELLNRPLSPDPSAG